MFGGHRPQTRAMSFLDSPGGILDLIHDSMVVLSDSGRLDKATSEYLSQYGSFENLFSVPYFYLDAYSTTGERVCVSGHEVICTVYSFYKQGRDKYDRVVTRTMLFYRTFSYIGETTPLGRYTKFTCDLKMCMIISLYKWVVTRTEMKIDCSVNILGFDPVLPFKDTVLLTLEQGVPLAVGVKLTSCRKMLITPMSIYPLELKSSESHRGLHNRLYAHALSVRRSVYALGDKDLSKLEAPYSFRLFDLPVHAAVPPPPAAASLPAPPSVSPPDGENKENIPHKSNKPNN